VCNLYNVTTTRDAVMQFTKAFSDKAGWNEPSLNVYPGYQAPIVRVGEDGQREIARVTWASPISAMSARRTGAAGSGRQAAASCRSPHSQSPILRARFPAAGSRTPGLPVTRTGL
jgi:putative SOS response-associated peptidase YedK